MYACVSYTHDGGRTYGRFEFMSNTGLTEFKAEQIDEAIEFAKANPHFQKLLRIDLKLNPGCIVSFIKTGFSYRTGIVRSLPGKELLAPSEFNPTASCITEKWEYMGYVRTPGMTAPVYRVMFFTRPGIDAAWCGQSELSFTTPNQAMDFVNSQNNILFMLYDQRMTAEFQRREALKEAIIASLPSEIVSSDTVLEDADY